MPQGEAEKHHLYREESITGNSWPSACDRRIVSKHNPGSLVQQVSPDAEPITCRRCTGTYLWTEARKRYYKSRNSEGQEKIEVTAPAPPETYSSIFEGLTFVDAEGDITYLDSDYSGDEPPEHGCVHVSISITDQPTHNPHDEPPEDPAPVYRHDCVNCTFLGSVEDHDLYFCNAGGIPTVIARFGSDGSEYESGMAYIADHPLLALAYVRSIEGGLL